MQYSLDADNSGFNAIFFKFDFFLVAAVCKALQRMIGEEREAASRREGELEGRRAR